MYKIEKKTYGVKLSFSGFILKDEMAKWVADSEAFIKSNPGLGKFGVVVDMTQLKPLQSVHSELGTHCRRLGQKRSRSRHQGSIRFTAPSPPKGASP